MYGWHQAFTEKFYGASAEGPSKCQNIHDSFKFRFVHLSSIKFLIGYYLMSISYHNVICGYKYQNILVPVILIESQNSFFLFFITGSIPNNL